MAVQMIEAIAQLEHYRIVHRDIKPSNFLVKSRSLPPWSDRLNGESLIAQNAVWITPGKLNLQITLVS